MPAQLLLATRNAKKLAELQRIVTPLIAVQVLGLDDVPAYDELPETGATFAENALIKAREGAARTGLLTLADDSGLQVDALNGMPGVLSARWSGGHGPDREAIDLANLDLVLAQIADVPDERRGASFVSAVAMVGPEGGEHVTHGVMAGRLIRAAVGAGGFGYDPIFVPADDPSGRTSAELTPSEKDAISHRGRALREILPALVTYFA